MEPIAMIAVSEAISALIGALVAGIIVRVKSTAKTASKEMRAIKLGVKAMLRKEIVDAYQYYIVEGHKMTLERYQELKESYEAYLALGGNGIAKRLFKEIEEKKPWIVMD